jgi:hypothetical protein
MADDEDEVINLSELESEDDEGKEKKPPAQAAVRPPPVPGPGAAPQTGLKDLERQIEAERVERARALNIARQATTERDNAIRFAQEAERRGVSTFELYVDSQIASITEQMDSLTAQQEGAYTDSDFKTVAAINRKLADLGGDLASAKRDKATLTQQREVMTQQHRQPIHPPGGGQQQPQVPTDPLERAIMNRTEPTKQFLRKHPELVRGDGSLKRQAIDAHDSALDAGHAVDTPAYFQFIEGLIGGGGGGNGEVPARGGRAPTLAAPVVRGGGGGGGGGSSVVNPDGSITVTPKMRRLAEEQGVPIKEWVSNYVRLVKEGRMTPIA